MKTKIIIPKGEKILKEYDFLITLNQGDLIEFNSVQYTVRNSYLDANKNIMFILVEF